MCNTFFLFTGNISISGCVCVWFSLVNKLTYEIHIKAFDVLEDTLKTTKKKERDWRESIMDSTAERRRGTFSLRLFFFFAYFTQGDKFPVDFFSRLCLKTILMNLWLYSHLARVERQHGVRQKLASSKLWQPFSYFCKFATRIASCVVSSLLASSVRWMGFSATLFVQRIQKDEEEKTS